MPKIIIDNQSFEVKEGRNLLEASLSLGFDLPYFCWHPALGSVGACRQCAVKQFKDENDKRGKIVMACMTPAGDDTRISIDDDEAKEFRAEVIEWLMTNHPHDCPVCDEGGECHLQDMTVMTGHNYRRYRFGKRTFRNQYLGPFINHEMNRCITCYRCVRFYRDYAGGADLDAFAAHNHVYFGRHQDGVLENEFSGNLVEVCPTGVFTDKSLKQHYTRKWDLQNAPSLCHHCGLGCNIIAGERYGGLRRILNRYHQQVNGYFICDLGRFGYEYVNSEKRIRQPLVRESENGAGEPVVKEAVLQRLQTALQNMDRVIGIGSPRASMESNFALRALVGPQRFFNGMPTQEAKATARIFQILQEGPARAASLHDAERADAVLVLGEDVTNTAPLLALALRQSVRQQPKKLAAKLKIPDWHDAAVREVVQQQKGPLYIATPSKTKLDEIATKTHRAAPEDIARLGFAIAHELNSAAPEVSDLPDELAPLAKEIAGALQNAERPLVVSGASLHNEAVVEAAANVAWALCDKERSAEICYAVSECNSLGMNFFAGKNLEEAFQLAVEGKVDTAIILENDLYRRASTQQVGQFLNGVAHVVVLDHLINATSAKAEIIFPASTFAEGSGTLINNEGRAQRFYKVFNPDGLIQESWRWIRDGMRAAGVDEARQWENLDQIVEALAKDVQGMQRIIEIAPRADFRITEQKIPREPHRYSGRTAMHAGKTVFEPKPPADPDSPLAFSMEGFQGRPPATLTPFYWSPAWNSVQATNKYQSEVGGPLRGDDSGIRLIEPQKDVEVKFFDNIPAAYRRRENEWLAIPLHHIFGSEELSVLSPGLAERVPSPYLALNSADAEALKVEAGMKIKIALDGASYNLPVIIERELPSGIIGLPVGLPIMSWTELPAWCRILLHEQYAQ